MAVNIRTCSVKTREVKRSPKEFQSQSLSSRWGKPIQESL